MPYRALWEAAQLDASGLTGSTNRPISFTVSSTNPEVKIGDIALFIDSKAGRLPIAIATNGIMSLPISAQLCEENPNVVANKPKGSMNIAFAVEASGSLPESDAKPGEGYANHSDCNTFTYIPWSQGLGQPDIVARVQHTDGNPGELFMFCSGRPGEPFVVGSGAYWFAYKDHGGKWWFGSWGGWPDKRGAAEKQPAVGTRPLQICRGDRPLFARAELVAPYLAAYSISFPSLRSLMIVQR